MFYVLPPAISYFFKLLFFSNYYLSRCSQCFSILLPWFLNYFLLCCVVFSLVAVAKDLKKRLQLHDVFVFMVLLCRVRVSWGRLENFKCVDYFQIEYYEKSNMAATVKENHVRASIDWFVWKVFKYDHFKVNKDTFFSKPVIFLQIGTYLSRCFQIVFVACKVEFQNINKFL